ncbi:MAG: YnbE family lipoprotein [Candidatus Electrothrix sp. AR4]|nr:YnbE family lipoprotein [Candidatus Electrothrix sp. AR4]
MTNLLVPCLLEILSLFIFGCTPKVEVAPPSEPITINLNVKIQHEILVKVDKELDNLFDEEKGLF